MGDKLNQTNNSADNNLGHFFKATDFYDIAKNVKIMKIILNISPYFVLEIVVMKRFVSVTACLIHNNYQSESHPRSLVKGFVKIKIITSSRRTPASPRPNVAVFAGTALSQAVTQAPSKNGTLNMC